MSSHNHAHVSSLLHELESLTHTQRTKHLIGLGQQSLTSPQTTHLITTLSHGTPYTQLLALKTIHGSRNLSLAKHLLSANSKYLRTQAINVICCLGSDEQVLDALKNVERLLQGRTVRRLWSARGRRRRGGIIDGFLEWLREEGEVVLWRELLPYGGREGLERGLPEVIGDFSLLEWGRLAKCWPEVAKRELWALIEASEKGDLLLRRAVCYIFTQWISHDSTVDYALNLVRKAVEKEKVPLAAFPIGWPKGTLFKRRPAQAVDLIVDAKDDLGTDVFIFPTEKLLRKISLQQFLALTKRYPTLLEEHMFSNLSTEQKLPAYELIRVAWRDENGALGWAILEQLPAEQRIAEARRHLKLKWLDTNPDRRIRYISLLPWAEAIELQKPYLRSSDADIRSEALQSKLRQRRYDSSHIEDALNLIIRHKNEPATMQREFFRALKEIPAARFEEEHLQLLTQIVRNALDSAGATIALYLLMEFVAKVLSVHPRWAAQQMALVVKERAAVPGRVQLSGAVPVKKVMSIVQKEMSPALESLLRKQDATALTTLARSFDTYIESWPQLLETCNKTFEVPEMEDFHEMMMEVVYKFKQPSGFWPRVIPLLTKDNKAVAGSRHIIRRIHRRYQNLLDPYIHPTPAPPSYTRKRDALNELTGGFWRWTPSQQEALAQIILKDIADEDVTSDKKVSYIWQLGLLPSVSISHLITLASDKRPIVQETALKALGRLDSSDGVPTLIEALGDERGRIAIYALRSALKDMEKSEAFEVLKAVPSTKVTVAKETVRIIGDLETEEAFEWLLEAEKGKLHASVRKALLRALWPYLDRDETWKIFNKAAEDTEPDVAKGVVDIPVDGMSFPTRQKHLALLLTLLNHPSPDVRLETLKRLNSMPLQDPDTILSPRLFELVRSEYQDEVDSATRAIFATYAHHQVPLIEKLYEELILDRKLLIRVHDNPYIGQITPRDEMKHLRPVTHAILAVLKKDRLSVKRRVKLMFEGLPWDELEGHLVDIVPELTSDALHLACEEIEGEGWRAGWKRAGDDFSETERVLREGRDERGRRIALSLLVGSVGENGEWTKEKRGRLEGYRGDESVLVAEAAWEVEVRGVDDEEEEEEEEEEE
jgi:HEAT repeat protein